eukprot:6191066-Pleurochrysis_carterae.AAC.2
MCAWVHALSGYWRALAALRPQRERVDEALRRQHEAEAEVALKHADLSHAEASVALLQGRLRSAMADETGRSASHTLTKHKLERAERLLAGLKLERSRWARRASEIARDLSELLVSTLLGAAHVTYSGPFSLKYRAELGAAWDKVVGTTKLPRARFGATMPAEILIDAAMLRDWRRLGLPPDQISVENALIMMRATRWPLLIDPQEQVHLLPSADLGGTRKRVSSFKWRGLYRHMPHTATHAATLLRRPHARSDPLLRATHFLDQDTRQSQNCFDLCCRSAQATRRYARLLKAHCSSVHADHVRSCLYCHSWRFCQRQSDIIRFLSVFLARPHNAVLRAHCQGVRWLRRLHASPPLRTVVLKPDADHVDLVASALKLGQSMILQLSGEDLGPDLEPLLQINLSATQAQGQRVSLYLGGNEVEIPSETRLYFATKAANPNLRGGLWNGTTVVNYCVTQEGLESQLLESILSAREPDLHDHHSKLRTHISQREIELSRLEMRILELVVSSDMSLLENAKLLDVVEQAVTAAAETAKVVEQVRGETSCALN